MDPLLKPAVETPKIEDKPAPSLINAEAEKPAAAAAFVPFTDELLKPLIPEGLALTPEQQKGFTEAFNTNYTDPTKLVGAMLELARDQAKAAAEAPEQAWAATLEAWKTSSKSDPVFGGAKLDESLATVQTVVDHYAVTADGKPDADFRAMLDLTGVGNHPTVIRFLLAVHKDMPKEAKPVHSNSFNPSPASLETLYPGMKQIGA